jgi:hypothetical protein
MAGKTPVTVLGIGAVGVLLAWSGLKGKKWTAGLRDLIAGQSAEEAGDVTIEGTPASIANVTGQSETGVASGAPPANASEKAWIVAMLAALGALPTAANIKSLTNWIARETPWPPVSKNNPLNTTQLESGSRSVNSVGVQAYPSAATGINATVTTLENGRYPAIVAALRAGRGLSGTGPWNAELATWSGGGYSSV